jgi:precorrin-6A/cobalt-precorrin-6A reductase
LKRLLILGGTGDAAELAAKAAQMPGIETIASLAGRTRQPSISGVIPPKNTRIGGFGGVAGLTDYLLQQRIDLSIDATHPFAAQISFNAAAAAAAAGIPHLMLIRPAWEKTAGDRWIEVDNYQAAADLLPGLAQRIFSSIGRQELAAFAHLTDLWFLMRAIDPPPPNTPLPPGELLLERGPFSFEDERSLLQQYRIEAIVSKNSGGDATYAKIAAARTLGLPVVMVQRPPVPPGESVSDLDSALDWLRNRCNTIVL